MKPHKFFLLVVSSVFGFTWHAGAASATWNGGSSSATWTNTSDWTPSGAYPGSTTSTVNADTATFTTAATFSSLLGGSGTLALGAINMDGSGNVAVNDTTGTLALTTTSPLVFSSTGQNLSLDNVVFLGAGTKTINLSSGGGNSLTFNSGTFTTGTNSVNFSNGTVTINSTEYIQFGNLGSTTSGNSFTITSGTLNVNTTHYTGTLTSGNAGFIAEAGGVINLGATESKRTQVMSGGSLYGTANGVNLGGILQVFSGTAVTQTATIGANISGSGTVTSGGISIDNGLNGSETLALYANTNNLLSIGASSGYTSSGTILVVKTGPGTVDLTGSNTFVATVSAAGGTFELGNNQALQNATLNTNVTGGGVFTMASGDFTPTFGGLTGSTNLSSSVISNYGSVTGITLNLATATTDTLLPGGTVITATFTGGIGDGAVGTTVTLTGGGTQVLAGANTYTGATQINNGTLSITGSLASGTVTVGGSSATVGAGAPILNGTGTITNSVIVASIGTGIAGTITPGTGTTPGTLTVGNITFQTGSTFLDNVSGSTLGELVITGSATVNSGADFSVSAALTTGTYTVATDTGGWSGTNGGFTLSGSNLSGWQLVASGNNLLLEQASSGPTTGTYTLTESVGNSVLHIGASTTATTTLANTGSSTADSLYYTGLGATAGTGSITGSSGTLTSGTAVPQGGTAVVTQTYTAISTGSDTVTGTATSVTGSSTGAATQAGSSTASVFVYSGTGSWTGTASTGSWGTTQSTAPANWLATGGIPGVTPGYQTTDSALFGTSIGTGTATISLNGANPYLNNITFNTAGSYNIAQGTSGTIHLDSASTATITDTAGNNTISAPVEFDAPVTESVGASSTLTLSGNITQTGTQSFAIAGPGTTIISGSNSYTGSTTISSGSTFITNTSGSALGSGALTVAAGATFGGSGSATNLSSYTIGATSSPQTTLQVGNGGSDATSTLTLSATGASSIKNTNLAFDLTTSGSHNTLSVGSTALTLSGDTLTLNVTTLGVIADNTPYILVAGTAGGSGNGGLGQYSGFTISGANNQISGLTLAFTGVGAPAGWYNNSYLFLVNNGSNVDDIEVEVVPEPGTWAMMIGGLALLVFVQRQRGARKGDVRQMRSKV